MITNERQYRITRAAAEKFKAAISDFDAAEREGAGLHPTLVEAELNGLKGQLGDLEEEISEYETLQSSRAPVIGTDRFCGLAEGLIAARIATGISQRELAERMGLKQQQIQRYEADRYANASLSRLVRVAEALEVEFRSEILVPCTPASFGDVTRKLAQVGVDSDFVTSRLLSSADSFRFEAIGDGTADGMPSVAARYLEVVCRVFGWERDQLLSSRPLPAPTPAGAQARLGTPAGCRVGRTGFYVTYANYLARLVLDATPHERTVPIPDEPEEFRKLVFERYRDLNLETLLHLCWDLGVPVVPLRGGGRFHGACWRISGRNVIVMKQAAPHAERWLFDLLHELHHASQRPEETDLSIVEAPETSAERRESDEEVQAGRFAGEVALSGRAEELAQLAVARSGGDVGRLKSVVSRISNEERVDVDLLAGYLAFRLQVQDDDWLGAAAGLRTNGGDPWEIARDVFCERFSFEGLDETDRSILDRAMERVGDRGGDPGPIA